MLMSKSMSSQMVHATHSEHHVAVDTREFRAYLVYRSAILVLWEVDKQGLSRNVERDEVALFPNEQIFVTLSIVSRSPVGLSDVRVISSTLKRIQYCWALPAERRAREE